MNKELPISPTASPSPATASGISILTAAQFQQLAEVPPEIEWFANIDNRQTRRASVKEIRVSPSAILTTLPLKISAWARQAHKA